MLLPTAIYAADKTNASLFISNSTSCKCSFDCSSLILDKDFGFNLFFGNADPVDNLLPSSLKA